MEIALFKRKPYWVKWRLSMETLKVREGLKLTFKCFCLVYVQAMTKIIEERIAKLTTFRGTFVNLIYSFIILLMNSFP